MLYNAGMKGMIRKTYGGFEFSHQKFWIVDNTEVHLSTGEQKQFIYVKCSGLLYIVLRSLAALTPPKACLPITIGVLVYFMTTKHTTTGTTA